MALRLNALYHKLASHGPFSPDAASAGRRSLRNANTALLLTVADDDAGSRSIGRRAVHNAPPPI